MSTFLVEIVTPERKVYAETANMVSVKGIAGELGILPNHIPLVTPLRIAPISIKRDGKVDVLAVGGGFIEVRKDKVVILAESAELASEIDVDRAQAAKQRAEERLAAKRDEVDFKRAELALQRASNRINVTER
ncbi:F0F1 ATP synthase subunit epsilon [Paenibacillus lupini]|jgi:F-type H+-transporting ATPase subunit epsilon|uniref:F0F1 ATP synthase subunit epsilon n=1 Tax=Paenibacillus lupini TaxID=1450204 RepID=UPI00141EDD63|nr:F0F1 ATP synthase subunit epsilon [Paenibacillus lupini]NIK25679.1 F-type H+-transporting ATPase subunit epsilon [Paenibacillus lupini]